MAIHRLEYSQQLRTTAEEAWRFFSSPGNLARITPPDLGFTILSPLPEAIYEGLCIEYRVRPLPGFTVGWLTEITHVRAPFYFCDEQRSGPYRIWHHEHFFEPQADGTLWMRDVVHYALPFAPFGDLAHPWLVRPRLEAIFAHRRKVVDTLFP